MKFLGVEVGKYDYVRCHYKTPIRTMNSLNGLKHQEGIVHGFSRIPRRGLQVGHIARTVYEDDCSHVEILERYDKSTKQRIPVKQKTIKVIGVSMFIVDNRGTVLGAIIVNDGLSAIESLGGLVRMIQDGVKVVSRSNKELIVNAEKLMKGHNCFYYKGSNGGEVVIEDVTKVNIVDADMPYSVKASIINDYEAFVGKKAPNSVKRAIGMIK